MPRRIASLLCSVAILFAVAAPAHAEGFGGRDVARGSIDEADSLRIDSNLRSLHGFTLKLSFRQATPSWYFDGNNLAVEMTCAAPTGGSFSVTLYRISSSSAEEIVGSADLRYQGFSKATWTNVGPGTYFFEFEKKADGITVFSSDVAAYSWS